MLAQHHQPLQALDATVVSEVERTARGEKLVRCHQGVADHDQLVVGARLVN